MTHRYKRVIPRDFFNEAKLLKCMGHLSLAILGARIPADVNIEISYNDAYAEECEGVEGFAIQLDPHLELLYVANYDIYINEEYVACGTIYNRKDPFPLYVYYKETEIKMFDEEGQFSEDFIKTFKKKKGGF